jgi:hypothetical protein
MNVLDCKKKKTRSEIQFHTFNCKDNQQNIDKPKNNNHGNEQKTTNEQCENRNKTPRFEYRNKKN